MKNELEEIIIDFRSVEKLRYRSYRFFELSRGDIGAIALPGGIVILTAGLIECYVSEEITKSELAGVVAHEIGHIELGHSKKAIVRGYWADKADLGALFVEASRFNMAGIAAGKFVIERRFMRKAERDADEFAAMLLMKSEYDNDGLLRFLEKSQRWGLHFPKWAEFISTHPFLEDRISFLTQKMAKRITPGDGESVIVIE